MVNSFRLGVLGITDLSLISAIAVMLGFFIALFLICLYLLNKGIGIRN